MIAEAAKRIKTNVQRVMVGREAVLDLILVALLCEGHVLIEDVPGVGKTTLAKALARSLGCTFRRIQFTPDLLPSDVTGITHFDQRRQDFVFRPGPVVSHVVLADEINRATPRTPSALLEAMEERQITVDGETVRLPSPFVVLATQNPIELEGTFPLPEAQIDRFLIRIALGYPDEAEEHGVLLRFEQNDPLGRLKAVTSPEELAQMRDGARQVRVESSVRDYVVRVIHATQAMAAVCGRDFVLPDDVKAMAPAVLTHRVVVNPQSRLRGATAEEVVIDVINTVPVPVERL
jgi:MoxR-like ATPase